MVIVPQLRRGAKMVATLPYELRTKWVDGVHLTTLLAPATVFQLVAALGEAVMTMNAAAEIAAKWGAGRRKYTFGMACVIACQGHLGTIGQWPVANMALLLRDGTAFDGEVAYAVGTEICIVHVKWEGHEFFHGLPLDEQFYASVRRTFAGHFESALRQMGL